MLIDNDKTDFILSYINNCEGLRCVNHWYCIVNAPSCCLQQASSGIYHLSLLCFCNQIVVYSWESRAWGIMRTRGEGGWRWEVFACNKGHKILQGRQWAGTGSIYWVWFGLHICVVRHMWMVKLLCLKSSVWNALSTLPTACKIQMFTVWVCWYNVCVSPKVADVSL